ncbi:class I SAM-dependent methyltransferase [bacterium]|nr:class I SAM-dependent methyltransferase [bacterium]
MDIRRYNAAAWDNQVRRRSPWTIPVTRRVIAAARRGEFAIKLTSHRTVPAAWFPPLAGARVLLLGGGGGQQGPVLAAVGAQVTVLDNSPAQLAQDRQVAAREGLDLVLVEGDMADLGAFASGGFDLVFNPCSTCFVPDLAPVWAEAFRVLRPDGVFLSGHMNPAYYLFDFDKSERGELEVRYTLPYADISSLPPDQRRRFEAEGTPYEFSHTLDALIGGQTAAGFAITGFYEDVFPPATDDTASRYMGTLFALRAVKPARPLP